MDWERVGLQQRPSKMHLRCPESVPKASITLACWMLCAWRWCRWGISADLLCYVSLSLKSADHLHLWLTTVSCEAAWLNAPAAPWEYIPHLVPYMTQVLATPTQHPTTGPHSPSVIPSLLLPSTPCLGWWWSCFSEPCTSWDSSTSTLNILEIRISKPCWDFSNSTLVVSWWVLDFLHAVTALSYHLVNLINIVMNCCENQHIFVKGCLQRKKERLRIKLGKSLQNYSQE